MQFQPNPTDQEIAAALAAIHCYLEQGASDDGAGAPGSIVPPVRPWSAAGALTAQGLPAARGGAYRSWGAAERAARAAGWSYGITGL